MARFYDELLDGVRVLPGASDAGAINTLPLTGGGAILITQIEEFPAPEGELNPTFLIRRAAPGYFEAMGIPVIEGRAFTVDDHRRRLGSLIISKSIKDEYWPDESALGKRLTVDGPPARVVGVVGDVHDTGLDAPAEQFVYKPLPDEEGGGVRAMTISLRTSTDPVAMVPEVRRVLERIDPKLPMTEVRSMDSVVADSLSRVSFTTALLGLAASIALFLGAIGIYGVVSYGVSQRTSEIGVRQALGASPGRVRRLVLSGGLIVGSVGILIGLVAAVALGEVLSSLLYGVTAYDGVALDGATIVFLAVVALASALPAARAARIPPATALREE